MIHGLIVVNKEKGVTSHTVVERIRRLYGTKKAGHFGTLDPQATGVILIALGQATRFFDFYVKLEKLYTGLIRFGFATSTYDSEGEPQGAKQGIDLFRIDLEALLAQFRGAQMQLPPMFSAKKFKGRPLYKYARRHQDLGQKTGVGAFLLELKRERIGAFTLQQALTLGEIEALAAAGNALRAVTPIEMLLGEFPKMIVNPAGRRCICNGMVLKASDVLKIFPGVSNDYFRIFDDAGKLLAIAEKEPQAMSFKSAMVFPENDPGS
ncbi:MAG: hypothetical protein NTZ12_05260 [Candidatus Aminicenantes bacterium]|nr:hypothetical protein [Candidatus Aminicenantes bacterium]